MENNRKEKFETNEQMIFKKNRTIAVILCRTSIVVSFMLFFIKSINVWKGLNNTDTYWCFVFMAMFGIVIGPWIACEYFFRKYCFEIESMRNEVHEFITEEHKRKRCDEIYDAVGFIMCIGAVLMFAVFFVLSLKFPEIISYTERMKS